MKNPLAHDHCPTCGSLLPHFFPESDTLYDRLFGHAFVRCRSCNSFCRWQFQWKTGGWVLLIYAVTVSGFAWVLRTIFAFVPTSVRDAHPVWYEAIAGVFIGCFVSACILFWLRVSFERVAVPESSLPTSNQHPVIRRLITYGSLCYTLLSTDSIPRSGAYL